MFILSGVDNDSFSIKTLNQQVFQQGKRECCDHRLRSIDVGEQASWV